MSGSVYAALCDDDADCFSNQICSLGNCMNIEDCAQDENCDLIEGHCSITDISPSVCGGELVDITLEGIIPIEVTNYFEFWGHSISYPNPWLSDCLLNYNTELDSDWSWEITNDGQYIGIMMGLYDQDALGAYEEIDRTFGNGGSKIALAESDNTGNCLSVPFKHTFRDIDLSSYADGIDGEIELYAACSGLPIDPVTGTYTIGEFGDYNGEDYEGYYSSRYDVSVDDGPPPQPTPNANPSDWTTDTTPSISGYSVVDPESGIDHYEYQIDSTSGSWTNVGTNSVFTLPSQSDGIHTVYVRAVDGCNPGPTGSVNVYIDTSLNCECFSGECCDGCYVKGYGSRCNQVELNEYECRDGHDLGSDVYVRRRYQTCDGNSATGCGGSYTYEWVIDDDCSPSEYCADDGDSSCTACSTTCDNSCQSSKCYGVDPDCTSGGGSSQCTDQGGTCSGGDCTGINCGYDTSDPCVDYDGCLRPGNLAYYMCDQDMQIEYGCKEGHMASDDVWEKTLSRYCSGTSPYCDGPTEWSWSQIEECESDERCANDGDNFCTAVPPETCNGIDDDWDGEVDDITGDLCPLQEGVCAGARDVCDGGAWQGCSSSSYGRDYEAIELRCDNLDNDCDGTVDGFSRTCGITNTGACSYGTEYCSTGEWGTCDAVFPEEETCDGIDSDCDGILDGDENLGTQQCYDIADSSYAGKGICSYGNYECTDTGWNTDCVGDVAPTAEVCNNGLDDDCDGYKDYEDDDCRCSNDAECGTDGFTGGKFCSGDEVWQTYREHTCINPGANDSYCNSSDTSQKVEECSGICESGQCGTVECYDDLDCGTDEWISTDYCSGTEVWNTKRTYSCHEPGSIFSECNYTDNEEMKTDCTEGCQDGTCTGIVCSSHSDCGENGCSGLVCQDGDVYEVCMEYWCINPGTTNSFCDPDPDLNFNETCPDGLCEEGACVECVSDSDCPDTEPICSNNRCVECEDKYDCGCDGNYWCPEKKEICSNNTCVGIECRSKYDCNYDYLAERDCKDGDVWATFLYEECINLGTLGSYCNLDHSSYEEITECRNGLCLGGNCSDNPGNVILEVLQYSGLDDIEGYYALRDSIILNVSACIEADDNLTGQVTVNHIELDCYPGYQEGCSYCQYVEPYGYIYPSSISLNFKIKTRNDTVLKSIEKEMIQDYTPPTVKFDQLPLISGEKVLVEYTAKDFAYPGSNETECSGIKKIEYWDGDTKVGEETLNSENCTYSNSLYLSTFDSDKITINAYDNFNQSSTNSSMISNVACFEDSDCGEEEYTRNNFCREGDVYQNYKTYSCLNPETIDAECSQIEEARLKQECSYGCRDGECKEEKIACSSDSDCGDDYYIGQNYCSGGDVYRLKREWDCVSSGTTSSRCEFSDNEKLIDCCTDACESGVCADIECYDDSDCGDDGWDGLKYCEEGDVYRDFIRYDCFGAGGSYPWCADTTEERMIEECDNGCSNGYCLEGEDEYACSSDSDCGSEGYMGEAYCDAGDIYQVYRIWECHNPDSKDAYCRYTDEEKEKESCSDGCSDGTCLVLECSNAADCGDDRWISSQYCNDGDVYQLYRTWSCNSGNCDYSDAPKKRENCDYGCEEGICFADYSDYQDLKTNYLFNQYPKSPSAGDSINMVFDIENIGEKDASDIEYRLYTGSSDSDKTGVVSNLAAGKRIFIVKTISYDSAGTYYPRIVLDHNKNIAELVETNNEKSMSLTIS